MAKTSPSKIVIDLTKCNKRACIFERTKKQNKVDPLNGLVIGNHPYFRNYTQQIIESIYTTKINYPYTQVRDKFPATNKPKYKIMQS